MCLATRALRPKEAVLEAVHLKEGDPSQEHRVLNEGVLHSGMIADAGKGADKAVLDEAALPDNCLSPDGGPNHSGASPEGIEFRFFPSSLVRNLGFFARRVRGDHRSFIL